MDRSLGNERILYGALSGGLLKESCYSCRSREGHSWNFGDSSTCVDWLRMMQGWAGHLALSELWLRGKLSEHAESWNPVGIKEWPRCPRPSTATSSNSSRVIALELSSESLEVLPSWLYLLLLWLHLLELYRTLVKRVNYMIACRTGVARMGCWQGRRVVPPYLLPTSTINFCLYYNNLN